MIFVGEDEGERELGWPEGPPQGDDRALLRGAGHVPGRRLLLFQVRQVRKLSRPL